MRVGGGDARRERPSEPGEDDHELERAVPARERSFRAGVERPTLVSGLSFLTLGPEDGRGDSPPYSPAGSVKRSSSQTPPPRPLRSPRRSNVFPTAKASMHALALQPSTSDPFLPPPSSRDLPSHGSDSKQSDNAEGLVRLDAAAVWQEAINSSLSAGGNDAVLARRASLRRSSAELFAASPPSGESPALSAGSSPGEGGVFSDGEGFVTADEDEGVLLAKGKGRSSRRTSRDGFPRTLPTILDTSPIMSRTLQSLRLTEPDEIPVSFGQGDLAVALGADDTDEEVPTSIRQLVRSHRNLSRSSSREFTVQDEERLSSRGAERQNDGLGLNLELFEGPISRYSPAVKPLLGRRSSSVEAISGLSTPMDTPGAVATSAAYPFPSTFNEPAARPVRSRASSSSSNFPPAPLAAAFQPSTSSINERSAPRLALGQIDTAPTISRSSSALPSPAPSPWTATPVTSSPISREASPAPPVISHRTSDDALSRPRPRSAGASLSSSKSFKRLSSVFSIGRSRSTSGQSLQEMAEELGERPALVQWPSDSRPRAQRAASDNSSFITAPEPSLSPPPISPRDSPGAISPSLHPSSPRKSPHPPLPSPRLASRASATSMAPSPASPFADSPSVGVASQIDSVRQVSQAAKTWRSNLDGSEYDSLLDEFSQTELRRQEVIWELAETERLFVDGLRGVMEIFAQPLRRQEGGWIKGMPTPIARLLDWASDIVYLHSQISAALQAARLIAPSPVVLRIAAVFAPFVSRLEIHQPYLIRFDAVNRMIEDMTADPMSDFGEFVRMQSALPECQGMSLGSYLLKPIQRLMKYPLFFKHLASLTPPSHPDHFDTLDLLESTDTIIRVMQEVKIREDEYEQVKAIASRLRGLPIGFQLARRDRRLLHQGQLRRVHINERDRFLLEADGQRRSTAKARTGARRGHDTPPVLRLSPNNSRPHSSVSEDDSGSSSVGAYDAGDLNAWPSPFTTPDSRSSTFSSTVDSATVELLRPVSVESKRGTSDVDIPHPPVPPLIDSSARSPPAVGPVSAFPNSMPARRSSKRIVKTKAKETVTQIFIFSDLVVLTGAKGGEPGRWTPKVGSTRRKSVGGDEGIFKVLEVVGVARVLGVADLSGKTEHDHLIKVDLLPLTASSERLTPISFGSLTSTTTALYFTVQPPASSSNSPVSPVRPPTLDLSFQSRVQWLQAFERCYLYSYRSLTQPSILNSSIAPITQTEHHLSALDTTFERNRGAADSAMLAKSPGELYMTRFGAGKSGEVVPTQEDVETKAERVAEREERVFWAGRLQKVRRESDVQDVEAVNEPVRFTVGAPVRVTSLVVPSDGAQLAHNSRRASR